MSRVYVHASAREDHKNGLRFQCAGSRNTKRSSRRLRRSRGTPPHRALREPVADNAKTRSALLYVKTVHQGFLSRSSASIRSILKPRHISTPTVSHFERASISTAQEIRRAPLAQNTKNLPIARDDEYAVRTLQRPHPVSPAKPVWHCSAGTTPARPALNRAL